ncbi:hypothetical protein [Sorangium cellulosum]|uniref:Uncharacterized protein n=1 Tax=Sorangium cellulosum So0157-2 TaxID=1254432 RepID=S4XLU6_SORCE|nr:hypothetical protein [Sorangium cellulosum]AGP33436.1 hypothetical protein SCE1572_02260 [Sorangium cellulosum So0157-2]
MLDFDHDVEVDRDVDVERRQLVHIAELAAFLRARTPVQAPEPGEGSHAGRADVRRHEL